MPQSLPASTPKMTWRTTMPDAPRDYAHALMHAQTQHAHPSQDWTGYCQKFVRSCYGIPMLFSSAWAQWLGARPEHKHPGGNPAHAPVGTALCYKGSGPYGHIMLAARPFPSGTAAGWSTDLVRRGKVDKVSRTAPETQWGQGYLGYLTAINGFTLPLHPKPAPRRKPEQVPYKALKHAIEDTEHALHAARVHDDEADMVVLQAELARLKRLYERLRRNQ